MPDAVHPPTDGSLATVTDFVDFNAQHNGSHPFWVFPPGDSSQAAAHISFAQAAAASHRVAHRMRPGRAGPEHEVLGVLVHTDTAYYAVLMLGALRAGFVVCRAPPDKSGRDAHVSQPYPMSPRNQPEAIAHMLKTTACTRVIVNEPTIPLLTQVQEELAAGGIALTVDQLTSFEDVFPSLAEGPASAESVPEYEPYLKPSTPLDIAATQLYLHSSGSTGFPKSIPFAYIRILEVFRERECRRSTSIFASLTLGLLTSLVCSVLRGPAPRAQRGDELAAVPSFGAALAGALPALLGAARGAVPPSAPAPACRPAREERLRGGQSDGMQWHPHRPVFRRGAAQPDMCRFLVLITGRNGQKTTKQSNTSRPCSCSYVP